MKKSSIVATFVLSLLAIVAMPLSVASTIFFAPSQFDKTFLGEFDSKMSLLEKQSEKKRIIMIGGSSVPFGVRTSLIEQELPTYDFIDFGLYAGLGTKFMIEMAKEQIRKDDIVIIAPEQSKQALSLYFNGELALQCLENRLNLINKLDENDKMSIVGDSYSFASKKMNFLLNGKPVINDIYKKDSFDENGDINSEICSNNIMPFGYDISSEISLTNEVIDNEFIDYLNSFNSYVNKRGAKCFYHFSPINKSAVTRGNIDEYYDYLNSEITMPILGDPNNSLMDFEWFYDTNFHLNNSGAIHFTYKLINELKAEFLDITPTNISLPPKPMPSSDSKMEGDDRDTDLFEYADYDDKLMITRLKTSQKDLIIPYTHENKKVISFDQNVFGNNKQIETITIQDNIAFLKDKSFEGCSNLKTIKLLNPNPSSIRIGNNLLDGTNANIYVPKTTLGNYKTNYFWSNYSDRIFAIE